MSERKGVRAWYEETTRRARRALGVASVLAVAGVLGFYSFAPEHVTLKLQILNGAWTIPAFGGLWLAAFIFIWLLPMREVSFRGQESMEDLCRKVDDSMGTALRALEPWRRLGERLEARFGDEALDRLERALESFEDMGRPLGPPPDLSKGLRALGAENGKEKVR